MILGLSEECVRFIGDVNHSSDNPGLSQTRRNLVSYEYRRHAVHVQVEAEAKKMLSENVEVNVENKAEEEKSAWQRRIES